MLVVLKIHKDLYFWFASTYIGVWSDIFSWKFAVATCSLPPGFVDPCDSLHYKKILSHHLIPFASKTQLLLTKTYLSLQRLCKTCQEFLGFFLCLGINQSELSPETSCAPGFLKYRIYGILKACRRVFQTISYPVQRKWSAWSNDTVRIVDIKGQMQFPEFTTNAGWSKDLNAVRLIVSTSRLAIDSCLFQLLHLLGLHLL